MVQSNLVELAKKGNPQAIASLMNQVLEPTGVVAKTKLDGNCLHIVFLSDQILSQAAIANFVKKGLTPLGIQSIQTVALYARKIGQDAPIWVERFSMNSAVTVKSPAATSSRQPALPIAAPTPVSAPVRPATPAPRPVASSKPQPAAKPKRKPSTAGRSQLRTKQNRRIKSSGRRYTAYPYQVAIAVIIGAFLIGGGTAFLGMNQSTQSSQAPIASQSASSVASPLVVPSNSAPANTPEGKVEAYLTQMNQAQRSFYQTHGKFATTLEELTRSGTSLSPSPEYTYRLVVREQAQAVLTATPKQNQLRSYSATVIITNATSGDLADLICKTYQPSRFPPIVAQVREQPVQCPVQAIALTR